MEQNFRPHLSLNHSFGSSSVLAFGKLNSEKVEREAPEVTVGASCF